MSRKKSKRFLSALAFCAVLACGAREPDSLPLARCSVETPACPLSQTCYLPMVCGANTLSGEAACVAQEGDGTCHTLCAEGPCAPGQLCRNVTVSSSGKAQTLALCFDGG